MGESLQHKLDRVRSPRVQITYDVETGGAIEMKEIPFVVGVLGDFSGNNPDPDKPLKKFKERKFVEIDRDNFNDVLKKSNPRLKFKVDDKLTSAASGEEDADPKSMTIELDFESLEDFHPENVVEKVAPLKELLETRRKLSELLTKLDGNDDLDELLQKVVTNTEDLKSLKEEGEEKKEGE